jgi:hypothetical protein
MVMESTPSLAPYLLQFMSAVHHSGCKNTANGAVNGIKSSQLQKDSKGAHHLAAPGTYITTKEPYQDRRDQGPQWSSHSSRALASDGLGLRRDAGREPFKSIGGADCC